MKSSLRKLTNAVLLVGLGFGLYYSGPLLHEIFNGGRPTAPLETAPPLADSPRESAGNAYLHQSLVNLYRQRSIVADASQVGTIEGRLVESYGDYFQDGSGENRRFHLRLAGKVSNEPVRLLQVSDGRFLFTDLKWGSEGEVGLQQVWRIDLRRLRKSLSSDNEPDLNPGQAAADISDPVQWSGLGGLPMLLESLKENFDFALPRQMRLRQMPVYAMVGFWKAPQRDRLLTSPDGQPAPDALPSRLPHHVLVVLGAQDLFPYRIEYRGAEDPLSVATAPPDSRYGESHRPLLKLEYLRPRFNVPTPEEKFVYDPPEGVDWMDRTSERLQLIQQRREVKLARNRLAPSNWSHNSR